jgi:hypothetical protein|tara:strand:+ start:104 stop:448 length:345 start_codon:yes stop_codon:yes gene_type:complete
MASLATKIKLYCEANSKTANFGPDEGSANVILQDDSNGQGPYIKSWSVDGLAKPTDEQIASYETAGNTEESNNTVRATRRVAYGDIGDQLDEIYKDMDAWKARIKSIKDANPKS